MVRASRYRIAQAAFGVYARLGWGTGEPIDFFFLRRLEWHVLRSYLAPLYGDSVCDVACGSGAWTQRLAGEASLVVGVDLDRAAIDEASRRWASEQVRFVCADALYLPFANASFDKVLCMCSLEHFVDDSRALSEIARILKPGGVCAMSADSLSHPQGLSGELLDRYVKRHAILHRYLRADLEHLAADAGLELQQSRYVVTSRLSNGLHRLWARWDLEGVHPHRMEMAFPLVYPLARMADALSRGRSGAILAAQLRRPAPHSQASR